jgi:hypothetical protein
MNKATAEKRLAALGFEIDWAVTGPAEGYWAGTIDAVGRGQIDGDCRGEVVHGDNAADWYKNAVQAAEEYAKHGPNSECTNPDCEFHEAHPINHAAA